MKSPSTDIRSKFGKKLKAVEPVQAVIRSDDERHKRLKAVSNLKKTDPVKVVKSDRYIKTGEKKVQINISLPESERDLIKRLARKNNLSIMAFVMLAVKNFEDNKS